MGRADLKRDLLRVALRIPWALLRGRHELWYGGLRIRRVASARTRGVSAGAGPLMVYPRAPCNTSAPPRGRGGSHTTHTPPLDSPTPKILGQTFLRAFGRSTIVSGASGTSPFRPTNFFGASESSAPPPGGGGGAGQGLALIFIPAEGGGASPGPPHPLPPPPPLKQVPGGWTPPPSKKPWRTPFPPSPPQLHCPRCPPGNPAFREATPKPLIRWNRGCDPGSMPRGAPPTLRWCSAPPFQCIPQGGGGGRDKGAVRMAAGTSGGRTGLGLRGGGGGGKGLWGIWRNSRQRAHMDQEKKGPAESTRQTWGQACVRTFFFWQRCCPALPPPPPPRGGPTRGSEAGNVRGLRWHNLRREREGK